MDPRTPSGLTVTKLRSAEILRVLNRAGDSIAVELRFAAVPLWIVGDLFLHPDCCAITRRRFSPS
jgi:hypothetical protein